jgi:hypothetical protein
MAIFSMIMMGAVMLVRPIQTLFKDTSKYADSNAALDNISDYLESVLVNANRVHMYVGWDNFDKDDNKVDSNITGSLPPASILSDSTNTKDWELKSDLSWGTPVADTSIPTDERLPIDFFADYFYLRKDMQLTATHSENFGVPESATRTLTINRGTLDTTLDNSKLQIYVLSILHNPDGSLMKPGDDSTNLTLGGIRLSTYKIGATAAETTLVKTENAVNYAYYDKYDYRLIFGEVKRNDKGSPIPSAVGSNRIFEYQGNFFAANRLNLTILAKETADHTTFSSSSLLYTSVFNLKNSGIDSEEDIYFNIKSSAISTGSGMNDPFNNEAYPAGYSSDSNYPIRPIYDKNNNAVAESAFVNNPEQYIKLNFMERYDGDFKTNLDRKDLGTAPLSVDKLKIFYKAAYSSSYAIPYSSAAYTPDFDDAANENIFIVFTLPKEFVE